MKILIACEFSGIVRDAFASKGQVVGEVAWQVWEQVGRQVDEQVRWQYGDD